MSHVRRCSLASAAQHMSPVHSAHASLCQWLITASLNRADHAPSLNSHYSMMPVLITAARMASQSERGMTSSFRCTQRGFIKCHTRLPPKMTGAQDSARGPGHHQIPKTLRNPDPPQTTASNLSFSINPWALISGTAGQSVPRKRRKKKKQERIVKMLKKKMSPRFSICHFLFYFGED